MNIFLNNLFCLARPFLANTEEVDLHGSIIQTASNISTDSSMNKTLELDYYEVIIESNYYLNYFLSVRSIIWSLYVQYWEEPLYNFTPGNQLIDCTFFVVVVIEYHFIRFELNLF